LARSRMYINPDYLQADRESTGSGQASNSAEGMLAITTRKPYYLKFYGSREGIFAIGSRQVDGPFSPYAGLLGETGLLGTWLYMGIYLLVLRQVWGYLSVYREDTRIFPLVTVACGFSVYLLANSVYGPFLETTRYTTILWSVVGLVCVYV